MNDQRYQEWIAGLKPGDEVALAIILTYSRDVQGNLEYIFGNPTHIVRVMRKTKSGRFVFQLDRGELVYFNTDGTRRWWSSCGRRMAPVTDELRSQLLEATREKETARAERAVREEAERKHRNLVYRCSGLPFLALQDEQLERIIAIASETRR